MIREIVLNSEDRSYFVDRLQELTGKPRRYWAPFPLFLLRKRLEMEVRRYAVELSFHGSPSQSEGQGSSQGGR